jgi:8-oxo-dGTP diphosphatase
VPRTVRYQGAIVHEHRLLLIQHREHASGRTTWLPPGGGQEPEESEEECVRREMREETGLDVAVERLLFDVPAVGGAYQRHKTFLCSVVGGQAAPGYEPEVEAAELYGIAAVKWFDLRDPSTWEPQAVADPQTLATLQRVQAALGYGTGEN